MSTNLCRVCRSYSAARCAIIFDSPHHTHYHIGYLATELSPASFFHLDPWLLAKVVGAALGNALAGILGAPTDLFAALGSLRSSPERQNTPLACTLMGVELFGATHVVYIATACFLAYFFSGHSGIYLSQRIGVPKTGLSMLPPEVSLHQVREMQASSITELSASLLNCSVQHRTICHSDDASKTQSCFA